MSFHVVAVDEATLGWVRISITECVEGGFTEIGGQRRVRKQASLQFELFNFLLDVSPLSRGQLSVFQLLRVSLRRETRHGQAS